MNTTIKLEALKEISGATTLSGMRKILEKAGQMLSPTFSKMESDEQNAKVVKFIIFIIALVAICIVTSFAYAGGDIAMSHGGSAALVCGAVDASLAIFLYAQVIKGKARWGALVFEIVTLALLGYLMTGYFGKDNLKTVTESKISADYEIVNKYRTNVQSIADQASRAAQNAAEVAQLEFDRDGKGVVYEKGMMIAGMKIDSVPSAPQFTKTPDFASLKDANKYLRDERKKLSDMISKISSTGTAIQQQVGGVNEGLKQAFAMGLSQQQTNNLQVLSGTLTAIEKADISNAKLSESVLTHDDLKADGMQGLFGYGADIIVIFFIVMLAVQKENTTNIDSVRDSEGKLLVQEILSDENIPFDSDKTSNIKFKTLHEAIKAIMTDESLKTYVKKQMSFNEYLEFMRDEPVLAKKLGSSKWSFAQIKKELDKDDEFLTIAQDAILMSPSAWKAVSAITNDPAMVLEMEEGLRDSFIQMLMNLNAKLDKPSKVKEFMNRFITSYTNVSSSFLKTLEICIEKLPRTQLSNLSPEFIANISPDVAANLCPMVDTDSSTFPGIVRSWKETVNDGYEEIINNGIVSQPQFARLWKTGVVYGGMDGLLAMIQAYNDKKKECSDSTVGNKAVAVEPDFTKLQTAMTEGKTDDFLSALKSSFVARAQRMNV
jgi:hypothetical protein